MKGGATAVGAPLGWGRGYRQVRDGEASVKALSQDDWQEGERSGRDPARWHEKLFAKLAIQRGRRC